MSGYHQSTGQIWVQSNDLQTRAQADIYTRDDHEQWRIRYTEQPYATGSNQTEDHTVITIQNGAEPAVRVRRFGSSESAYGFMQGSVQKGFWRIKEGQIPLWIHTQTLRIISVKGQIRVQIEASWSDGDWDLQTDSNATPLQIEIRVTWSDPVNDLP